MSSLEIDDYLSNLEPVRRATLEQLRRDILECVPDAEQGLSYGVPAFRERGKLVAGFSAAKHHLSYLPHSGTVLGSMPEDVLAGFTWSKGALKFAIGQPLPRALVRQLIDARLRELA